MKVWGWLCLAGLVASVAGAAERQQDIVLADFEGGTQIPVLLRSSALIDSSSLVLGGECLGVPFYYQIESP